MSHGNHDTTVAPVQVADLNDGILEAEDVKPNEVPDGGTAAWLQVLGAFCLYWNTW